MSLKCDPSSEPQVLTNSSEEVPGLIDGKSGLKYAGPDLEAMRDLAAAYSVSTHPHAVLTFIVYLTRKQYSVSTHLRTAGCEGFSKDTSPHSGLRKEFESVRISVGPAYALR